MMPTPQWLPIIWFVFVLSACGFQLRGMAQVELPASLQTLYIQGLNLNSGMGQTLKQTLTRNGVRVVDNYQAGSAVLSVLENSFERRVLSVGSRARVSEYELESVLRIRLTAPDQTVLIDDERFDARRDYQFDENQVLSVDEEQRFLRESMETQLVQSLMRRLAAVP